MRIKSIVAIFSILLLSTATQINASEKQKFFPAPMILLDNYFSHHVLVAEKSTHKLHLFQNKSGVPTHIKTFKMATGKKSGDKFFQGDHRTPEGVYHFTQFLSHQDLLDRHGKVGEIYGVGAFVLNYPNSVDRRAGKTGGGIWLHSTNEETRIEKGLDSRGCIVAANKHLIEISKYLELNRTSIVVVENLHYYTKAVMEKVKEDIKTTVKGWLNAWQKEDIQNYLSFYHPEKFHDPFRGNYKDFSNYKRAIFSRKGQPEIQIDNLNILQANGYAVATFRQDYKSNTINDMGRKTLYLVKDEYYNWKIVSEVWNKIKMSENNEQVAFQPSMRFFDSANPAAILQPNSEEKESKN